MILRSASFCFLGFTSALVANTVFGAEPPATNRVTAAGIELLDEVVVTATRAASTLRESPGALTVIDWDQYRSSEATLTIDEPLRRVPGVFVQNSFNFAQDQRIAIRGFGTRAAFGVREIKVLVDGIPESSPDGQTQLDNIDFTVASSIEVLRGPAAALYGNASGGVINVLTDDGTGSPPLETRLIGGSHGLHKYGLKTSGQGRSFDYRLNGSWTSLAGYRDHSSVENRHVGGKLRYYLNDVSDVTVVLNYADSPWAQDAGGLTRAEVDQDRRQARARNVALAAGEQVNQGKLGFVYRNELSGGNEIVFTQYSLFREFANKLPILPAAGDGIVEFERIGLGGGIKYVGRREWDDRSNQLVAGIDAEFQEDDRRRFANLNGARGALGFDQLEVVRGVGPFVRNEFRPSERLALIAGVRYDNLRFEAEDRFLVDGNDSGTRTLDQMSYAGGIRLNVRTNLQIFANVSTAFQTPTTTELADPTGGGGFNPALNPQAALTYELGSRSQLNSRLQVELTLFFSEIDDELIPFTSPTGRDFFRNAGRSERKGIELAMNLRLAPGVRWQTSYTAMDATYRDYVTAGGNFSGNSEPGIPAHQLFTELSYRSAAGAFGSLDLQFVDRFELNDANTASNNAYTLLNARLGYSAKIGHSRLIPFIALNNLLNQKYNGQTRINAFGGRFFEPSPRLTVFGGLTWRLEF
jgi:iron complex outermembrane receptor protein